MFDTSGLYESYTRI